MGVSSAEEKESATPPFQNLILYFFFGYMYMHAEDGCPTPRKYPFIMQYMNINMNILLEKNPESAHVNIVYYRF